jgi:hypothetical protein
MFDKCKPKPITDCKGKTLTNPLTGGGTPTDVCGVCQGDGSTCGKSSKGCQCKASWQVGLSGCAGSTFQGCQPHTPGSVEPCNKIFESSPAAFALKRPGHVFCEVDSACAAPITMGSQKLDYCKIPTSATCSGFTACVPASSLRQSPGTFVCKTMQCTTQECCSAPTCTDKAKNGDETGVDCGGSCALACPCDASAPPANGANGDCVATLASGATCSPTCNQGYLVSGKTSCSKGVLTAATCKPAPCSAGSSTIFTVGKDSGPTKLTTELSSGATATIACKSWNSGYRGGIPLTCSNGIVKVSTTAAHTCKPHNPCVASEDDCAGVGHVCTHTGPGKHTCSCGINTFGDGRKQGTACTACPSNSATKDTTTNQLASACVCNLGHYKMNTGSCAPVACPLNSTGSGGPADGACTCVSGYQGSPQLNPLTNSFSSTSCVPKPCDASVAPVNGAANDCTATLASGATCSPTCKQGYTVSGKSSCSLGALTSPTCAPNPCDASKAPANGAKNDCSSTLASGKTCSPTCNQGYTLSGKTSCKAGVLTAATCGAKPTCSDGKQNGDETDIDCGGSCKACPTCSDKTKNGDETDIDCGGSCKACPTCSDKTKNGDETGVDCGGSCKACPTCSDKTKNGDETGVDCGGSCTACPCDASSAPANGGKGNCTASVASGTTCQPVCSQGYTVSGKTTCSKGILTAATCKPVTCTCPDGTPTVFTGSTPATRCEQDGVDCSACNVGHKLSAPAGGGAQTCSHSTCNGTTAIADGAKGDCTATMAKGSKCQPTCNRGYVISGVSSCSSTGQLQSATCTQATCTSGTIAGTTCNCDAGYTGGGAWVSGATYPACSEKPCDASSAPANGGKGDCTTSVASGTTCQPVCNQGYTVSGKATCSKGVLTAATCGPSPCDASSAPAHGGKGDCTVSLASGATCSPTCNKGYLASGKTSCSKGILTPATCSPVPTCSDKEKNGDELGVDCGGSCLQVCAPCDMEDHRKLSGGNRTSVSARCLACVSATNDTSTCMPLLEIQIASVKSKCPTQWSQCKLDTTCRQQLASVILSGKNANTKSNVKLIAAAKCINSKPCEAACEKECGMQQLDWELPSKTQCTCWMRDVCTATCRPKVARTNQIELMCAKYVKNAVKAAVKLTIDVATIPAGSPARANFEAAFSKDVAGVLNITADRIKVTDIVDVGRRRLSSSGTGRRQLGSSAKVEYMVLPDASGAPIAATSITTAFAAPGVAIGGTTTTAAVTAADVAKPLPALGPYVPGTAQPSAPAPGPSTPVAAPTSSTASVTKPTTVAIMVIMGLLVLA